MNPAAITPEALGLGRWGVSLIPPRGLPHPDPLPCAGEGNALRWDSVGRVDEGAGLLSISDAAGFNPRYLTSTLERPLVGCCLLLPSPVTLLAMAPPKPPKPLKPRAFLNRVVEAATAGIEPQPSLRMRASIAQIYFDDRHQHYEVWLRRTMGLVELGLHFEGAREENLRRIALLADSLPEVLGGIGGDVEVEERTESWTRLHEVRPLTTLTDAFARELGERIARYIEVLEPILATLGPMPAPMRSPHARSRWSRKRRRGPAAAPL